MKYTLNFFITYLCMPMIANAIAVSDLPVSEANPTNIAAYSDFNWDHVYNYKNSSAVAVHGNWLITAAHVADDGADSSLTIQGEVYTQMQQVYHPDADLALIRYDKTFPEFYSIHNGSVTRIGTNPELLMVGWGNTGLVSITSFQNGPGGRGIKRWGTNRAVTSGQSVTVDMGGEVGTRVSDVFTTSFNLNDTFFESGAAQYDSGSGVFIKHAGQWKLAGLPILLAGSGPNYTGNYIIKIQSYISWINNILNDFDSDGDQMPDHFEMSYGNGQDLNPFDDLDNDGQNNLDEWFSDTNPLDSASFFYIFGYSNPSAIEFQSSASREYQLQFCTNLVLNSWVETNSWNFGQPVSTTLSVPTNVNYSFKRIGVRIP